MREFENLNEFEEFERSNTLIQKMAEEPRLEQWPSPTGPKWPSQLGTGRTMEDYIHGNMYGFPNAG